MDPKFQKTLKTKNLLVKNNFVRNTETSEHWRYGGLHLRKFNTFFNFAYGPQALVISFRRN
jgi:hypothetical protein